MGGPPLEDAVINQRCGSFSPGLTGGACRLRAIRGGLWRRLGVTHGHSVTLTCAVLSIGGDHMNGKEIMGLFSSSGDQQKQTFVQVNTGGSIWIK